MRSTDLANEPFLTVEQDIELSHFDETIKALSNPDKSTDLETHAENLDKQIERTFVHGLEYAQACSREAAELKFPSNISDLERKLQLQATVEVAASSAYDLVALIGSMAVATEAAKGNDMEVVHGLEFTNQMILNRARQNATALITATIVLTSPDYSGGSKVSLWDEATQVSEKSPKLPKTSLDEANVRVVVALHDRLREFAKGKADSLVQPSKFKILNSARARKAARVAVNQAYQDSESVSSFEGFTALLAPIASNTIDLTDDEIANSVRVADRMAKHIKNAARIKPRLTSDPQARYLEFLQTNLLGYDLRSEREALQRRIVRLTEREKRLLARTEQPTTNRFIDQS